MSSIVVPFFSAENDTLLELYWQKVGEDDNVCTYQPGISDPVRGPDYVDNIDNYYQIGMIFFVKMTQRKQFVELNKLTSIVKRATGTSGLWCKGIFTPSVIVDINGINISINTCEGYINLDHHC